MRPSFHRPARARPQRSTIDAYALVLILNLLQRVMDSEYKPPVTLALLAGGCWHSQSVPCGLRLSCSMASAPMAYN